MSATPCDRCGETPATLIFARGRLLCLPCHAALFPTPAPEPRRQGRCFCGLCITTIPPQYKPSAPGRCSCGLCPAPVLPGFEHKAH